MHKRHDGSTMAPRRFVGAGFSPSEWRVGTRQPRAAPLLREFALYPLQRWFVLWLWCGNDPPDQDLTPWVTASCANPSQLTDLIHGQPPSPRLSATPSDLYMLLILGHPVRRRYAQYRDKTLDKRNTDRKNRAWSFTPQISTSPRGDTQAPGSRTMCTAVQ